MSQAPVVPISFFSRVGGEASPRTPLWRRESPNLRITDVRDPGFFGGRSAYAPPDAGGEGSVATLTIGERGPSAPFASTALTAYT
ncbi:MAG: hypothetical protein QOE90_1195 [Thermoplasmata archaeon]|nr:hypothetical protein [Thermoplasmata archaeon]